MKEKYILIIISLFSIFGCKPKTEFDWNAGLSAPKNYPSGAPFVEFFYEGKSVGGTSIGTGADQGWGVPSGGHVGANKYKEVPDSVFVSWVCSLDNYVYKGGTKLPRDKMIELFKQRQIDNYGTPVDYGQIVAGMAPGGNVTIWMRGGGANTEIIKFMVKDKFDDPYIDENYKIKTYNNSWRYYLDYWNLHGVPYKVWETREKEYNYEIFFLNNLNKKLSFSSSFLSKDGSIINFEIPKEFNNSKEIIENYKTNQFTPKKIPVHLNLQWAANDNSLWYTGKIIFPLNFSKVFQKFYSIENKALLIIRIDKIEEVENCAYGSIYIQNNTSQEFIMKFRLAKFIVENKTTLVPEYSLPKGFQFPKWEGRVPIEKPTNFKYWQEK